MSRVGRSILWKILLLDLLGSYEIFSLKLVFEDTSELFSFSILLKGESDSRISISCFVNELNSFINYFWTVNQYFFKESKQFSIQLLNCLTFSSNSSLYSLSFSSNFETSINYCLLNFFLQTSNYLSLLNFYSEQFNNFYSQAASFSYLWFKINIFLIEFLTNQSILLFSPRTNSFKTGFSLKASFSHRLNHQLSKPLRNFNIFSFISRQSVTDLIFRSMIYNLFKSLIEDNVSNRFSAA